MAMLWQVCIQDIILTFSSLGFIIDIIFLTQKFNNKIIRII